VTTVRAPIFGRDVPDAAWRPTAELLADSRLAGLLRTTGLPDLEALQARAVDDPAWFWGAAVDDLELSWQHRPRSVIDVTDGAPWARWWVGGSFNYAQAATAPVAGSNPNGAALTWEGEPGDVRTFTTAELRSATLRAARMFRELGVQAGDRVGVFLPMLPETAITVLALGIAGAIYTPIFSGYGAPAVASRLSDCGARFLVTADGFWRRGNRVDMKRVADEALASAPSVERVILVPRLRATVDFVEGRDVWWSADLPGQAEFREALPRTDPEAPFMLIYTSGTTGRPKAAVHVHGGFPIKAAEDLAHTFDLRRGDALFWFTDLGWMMGPWAIAGSLLLGGRLVMYEGAPDFPGPDRIWSLAARHRVTHLGVSPTVVRALMAHGTDPVRAHDLTDLRVLGSTGEPWDPESWWWLFREVGRGRTPIVNYSGGTEVSGGIVGCNLLTPIRPASFNGPCAGMAADVVGPDGEPVRGDVGELVIRRPHPGQTRGFWNDPDRYLETYWNRWPGTWVHGDWAVIDQDGYWYIRGRSDDTLKVAGKRVGPAEVESAACGHPAVREAAAVAVPDEMKGDAVVVFAVLNPGHAPDETLREEIRNQVAASLGKALRPERVLFADDLPKTRNAKVLRRVIRAVYLAQDPGDLTSLENAATLDAIRAAR
jgi:acetyl-CoA synthetase